MDRTRKLLMGVTASALITGASADVNRAAPERTVTTAYEQTPQTDPKVTEAANVISTLLYGVQEQNAMTLNQLLAKRPDLNRPNAEKAIADLFKRGLIRRTGDGSQYKPYRYYDKSRGGAGG